MQRPSVTFQLADFAAGITPGDIPPSAVRATKRLVMDALGCAVGGQASASSQAITRVMSQLGGESESTVLVSGRRLPASSAAYINSHYGNALDADETMLYTGHVSTVTVPSALAVAERQHASGRDFLTAVLIGFEIASRVGLSLKLYSFDEDGKMQFAPVHGYSWITFASAISTSHLLGLSREQIQYALGIAAASAPLPTAGRRGYMKRPRPMQKYALNGVYAQAGVVAALLAQQGFTADPEVLDGSHGFWRIMGSAESDWKSLTDALGKSWLVEAAAFKPYPSCRYSHAALELYQAIATEHALRPDDIDQVEVLVHGVAMSLGMHDPRVQTEIDAQFSIPYQLGLLANGHTPGPDWQSAAMRTDDSIAKFASKVRVSEGSNIGNAVERQIRATGRIQYIPSSIKVTAGGRVYEADATYTKGDPGTEQTAMSDKELATKFRRFSLDALGQDQTEKALDVLGNLEHEADVQPLVNSLIRPAD